jgi:hypothetical protein
VNHANEHGARVRGLDSSGGGILAATLQGRRSRGGPLAKLGEYLDPSRPHRDGEPVASRFLVSRKPILNLGGLLAGFADLGGKTKSARNEKRGDGRHLLPAAAAPRVVSPRGRRRTQRVSGPVRMMGDAVQT